VRGLELRQQGIDLAHGIFRRGCRQHRRTCRVGAAAPIQLLQQRIIEESLLDRVDDGVVELGKIDALPAPGRLQVDAARLLLWRLPLLRLPLWRLFLRAARRAR